MVTVKRLIGETLPYLCDEEDCSLSPTIELATAGSGMLFCEKHARELYEALGKVLNDTNTGTT